MNIKKPLYKYPDFVKNIELEKTAVKRFWLELSIDKSKDESIVVILKNPSRANKDVSDKTVYNVSNYIYRNRDRFNVLSNVKSIIILNLIPHYQTYSNQLIPLKNEVVCQENIDTIRTFTSKHSNVIIAWGNHPSGLYDEYESIKSQVLAILQNNKNKIFYVDKLSMSGNPKHGQVWGYSNNLIRITNK